MRIASLIILCLALAVIPAVADVNNGPINGSVDGWTINFGYVVSNTFAPDGNSVSGFALGLWLFPGDTVTSVDWSITSDEFGGTVYGAGTASGANLVDSFISSNQYGYNIDLVTVSGLNVDVTPETTYWLNLSNAVVESGDPVYWDENSGPAIASESSLGTIASEAFTVNTVPGTTPEPGSILLFGSGILGLAGLLRRRLL